MTITSGLLSSMETAMKQAMGDMLAPQSVDLYGAGTVSVKLHVGMRRPGSPELTGGADQESQIATIDADDWDTKAGRPPQKGDVITWADRRYAVLDAHVSSPDGANRMFYKARLRG